MRACKLNMQSLLRGHFSIKFSPDLDALPSLRLHSRKGMWQLGEVLKVAPATY